MEFVSLHHFSKVIKDRFYMFNYLSKQSATIMPDNEICRKKNAFRETIRRKHIDSIFR